MFMPIWYHPLQYRTFVCDLYFHNARDAPILMSSINEGLATYLLHKFQFSYWLNYHRSRTYGNLTPLFNRDLSNKWRFSQSFNAIVLEPHNEILPNQTVDGLQIGNSSRTYTQSLTHHSHRDAFTYYQFKFIHKNKTLTSFTNLTNYKFI